MADIPVLTPCPAVGHDLVRPESVLTMPDGSIYVSDRRGLACRLSVDGTQTLLGNQHGLPNGLTLLRNGVLAVADIQTRTVYALAFDGRETVLYDTLGNGMKLGAVNFPYVGPDGELWISVSTTADDLAQALNQPQATGQLLRTRRASLEVISQGLYFANEFCFDAAQE